MSCIHFRRNGHFCRDCGAELCNHHKSDLAGCLLEKGHEGDHSNPNTASAERERVILDKDWLDLKAGQTITRPKSYQYAKKWKTEEGAFIASREDWYELVDRLGK